MDNVVVFKTSNYVQDGVDLANMAEELVAKAFALAGPFYQSGDVDKFHLGGNLVFGVH